MQDFPKNDVFLWENFPECTENLKKNQIDILMTSRKSFFLVHGVFSLLRCIVVFEIQKVVFEFQKYVFFYIQTDLF